MDSDGYWNERSCGDTTTIAVCEMRVESTTTSTSTSTSTQGTTVMSTTATQGDTATSTTSTTHGHTDASTSTSTQQPLFIATTTTAEQQTAGDSTSTTETENTAIPTNDETTTTTPSTTTTATTTTTLATTTTTTEFTIDCTRYERPSTTSQVPFDTALQTCEDNGMNLPVFESHSEYGAFVEMVAANSCNFGHDVSFWIGLVRDYSNLPEWTDCRSDPSIVYDEIKSQIQDHSVGGNGRCHRVGSGRVEVVECNGDTNTFPNAANYILCFL